MCRHPPRATRTGPPCSYTTLVLSVAVVAILLVQHVRGAGAVGDLDPVDHRVGPLLAVAEVEVLYLHASRQQVGEQRVGHGAVGGHAHRDDQRLAFLQRRRFPRLAVGAIPLALNLDLAERSEEHTSELQSLMRISYAVFCLKKKKN